MATDGSLLTWGYWCLQEKLPVDLLGLSMGYKWLVQLRRGGCNSCTIVLVLRNFCLKNKLPLGLKRFSVGENGEHECNMGSHPHSYCWVKDMGYQAKISSHEEE